MPLSSPNVRPPFTHKMKALASSFGPLRDGTKTHDLLRRGDPDFRVGDLLLQREYDPEREAYTGAEVLMRITYITSVENACALSPVGLSPEHAILSVELVRGAERDAA